MAFYSAVEQNYLKITRVRTATPMEPTAHQLGIDSL